MKKSYFLAVLLVIGTLSASVCQAKNPDLKPGDGSTGFSWKRAADEQKRQYCEKIAEKFGMGKLQWEVFNKSLNVTFDTSNAVTLKMNLDETAKAIKQGLDNVVADKSKTKKT